MTSEAGTTHTFEAASIAEAAAQALAFIFPASDGHASDHTVTLVYRGEGPTVEDALRDALDDIRAQCLEQGCTPHDVTTDGVMATDTGTRIWGTVSCATGATLPMPNDEIDITAIQKGEQWELTVMRR